MKQRFNPLLVFALLLSYTNFCLAQTDPTSLAKQRIRSLELARQFPENKALNQPAQVTVTTPTQGARVAAATTVTFTFTTKTITTYTVPSNVYQLTIEARGAEGNRINSQLFAAGKGAIIVGTVAVTPGQRLKILVGQKVTNSYNDGGGGSFVTDINNNPLVVAGGGGGAGSVDSNQKNGQEGTSAGNGVNGGSGGSSGRGGGNGYATTGAGGQLTDGTGTTYGSTNYSGGKAFINGGQGADDIAGFGGGGLSVNNYAGGGGGGYSGGGGGGAAVTTARGGVGGGGGSYNVGINQTSTAGANSGNGLVIFTYTPCSPFTASLTNDGPLTCAKTSVKLTATGGLDGATYAFSSGATANGSTATVMADGPYSVTVTNPSGCSASARTTVMSNTAVPTVSITPSGTAICAGQTATFTASGDPASYSWSSGQTMASISATAQGPYSVTATSTSNGCPATASAMLTVNPLPTPAITNLATTYCKDAAIVPLTGNPSGGAFTVDGNTTTTFNPASLSVGQHTVVYAYTNANGCSNTASQMVTVNELPTPAITNLAAAYCKDATPITLSGTPSGGAFTLDGNAATALDPVNLSVGQHTVVYFYTNSSGCSATATQTLTINALPTPTIDGLATAFCQDATPVALTGSPSGGMFTVDGITATSFNPAKQPAGQHTVVYSYTNNNGCSNTASQTVTVNELPTPVIANLGAAYCVDANAVTLSGTPAGGAFTLDGNPATTFNPAKLQVGQHTVVYSYTNSSGCSNTASQTITVNEVPTPAITNLSASYCKNTSAVTLSGTPSGGAFTIDGTPATTLDPSILSVSQHTVVYSYTNSSGCSATANQTVAINALPTPSITNLAAAYCKDAAAVTLAGSPTGGVFTVDGTTNPVFNPANLSVGQHTVVYSYTNASGCSATANQLVTVKEVPQMPSITTQSGGSYPAGQSNLIISQNTGNVILGVSACAGGTITWSGGNSNTLAVSTTNTGTQTFTATCTSNGCTSPVGTATVTVVVPTLRVFSRDPDNGQLGNNTIKPYLQLQNVGTTAINYSTITVRYYLTTENNIPLLFQKNYIAIGQNNVQLRYVALPQTRQGATGYIEYSFSAGAGSLAPGGNSGPIETQINKQDYSVFNQLDDYSYINNSAYTLNPRITAYQNGVIFYGTEPGPGSPRLAAEEVGTGLLVKVLGNPVTGSQAQVEISGAEGQRVNLSLTDLQGRPVHQQQIDQAGVIERVSVPVGGASGLLLLQVATPTQRQQIKLVKP